MYHHYGSVVLQSLFRQQKTMRCTKTCLRAQIDRLRHHLLASPENHTFLRKEELVVAVVEGLATGYIRNS